MAVARVAGQGGGGGIGVSCAIDDHFGGIMQCWPEEWGRHVASVVLDVAVAIRAGKVMVAVLHGDAKEQPAPSQQQVVGWIVWDDRFIPGSLYLRRAAVHKDYRNRGVLGAMLTRIVDFASHASFTQIVADLGPDSGITPEYAKRLGGQPIGEVKGLAGDNYVTTFWSLKPRVAGAKAS